MPPRADPIVDQLLAGDLPGITARARDGRARAQRGGSPELAAAWKLLEQACDELLLPSDLDRHSTVQPTLFPMSRVKSARKRRQR